MVGVRSSTARHNAAAAREQAMLDGHEFIELKLLDAKYDGVQGFEVLQTSSFVDPVTNAAKYNFAVAGGPLRFERDESRAGRYHQLIDTEHNRKVLRSVSDSGMVEIVDKAKEKEILSGKPLSVPAATGAPQGPEPLMMTKEEYLAGLEKLRAAGEIPAVVVGVVGDAGSLDPVTVPNPPIARKASKPPVLPVGGSPLVQVADEE